MQLTPRYLVKNQIDIISNHAGLGVEYRPVFQRNIRITRGIDNVIYFRLLNADQKPVPITGTPYFVAFNDERQKVIEKPCEIIDDGSTRATLGNFTATITDSDLLDIPQQYLKYNIYILGNSGQRNITYTNTDFTSSGIIYVDGESYPDTRENFVFDNFYKINENWYATPNTLSAFNRTPSGTYTAVVYNNGYTGTVTVEATLESSPGLNWFAVGSVDVTGTDTSPVGISFTGVYQHLRIKVDTDPGNLINRVVIRN
jgi:hypothetical protein